ncbi:MAG: histidinol dehydrogenase [Candidatus Thermoplasmatota archaeon]|jgi:histidinol dehydrogenase
MAEPDFFPIASLDDVEWVRFIERAQAVPQDVLDKAKAIVDSVRDEGDAALRRWSKSLDGVDLEDPFVSRKEWQAALREVPSAVRKAVDENLARIQAFHRLQKGSEQRLTVAPGVRLGRRPVPFDAVGCYVPGGRATYPSTVLMTVTPARIAGCKTIVVATPPRKDGRVDPVVLYAAKAAGATHVLRAGGAQAIAALAFGTTRIPAVQAIVGPGNAYVTAAKQLVAGRVHTDAPAGPSELLIIADKTAHADEVALDLLAQAEHDPDAHVVLVATDNKLARKVRDELVARLPATKRRAIIEASLRDHGALLVAKSLAEALRFSNDHAPEHLTLMVRNPQAALAKVRNAGSVFLGRHAPVSLGDYGSGTNHVLPTMGHARVRGGLSVEDFRKWVTWQDVTAAGLARIGPAVATLARAEGLICHAEAVEKRLETGR